MRIILDYTLVILAIPLLIASYLLAMLVVSVGPAFIIGVVIEALCKLF